MNSLKSKVLKSESQKKQTGIVDFRPSTFDFRLRLPDGAACV